MTNSTSTRARIEVQTPQPPDQSPPTPIPPDTNPDPTRDPPEPLTNPIGDPPPGPNESPHM